MGKLQHIMRKAPHIMQNARHIMQNAPHIMRELDIRQCWRSIKRALSP